MDMKKTIILLAMMLFGSNLSFAQAECTETPPDGLNPLAALSLFNDNYRNGDYEFALKYGRWMHCAKPETLEGYPSFSLKTQYDRLVKVYSEIGKSKEDPAIRAAYIDTATILLDESLELFGDTDEKRFSLHLDRGRFFQANYTMVENGLARAYGEYEKMFELDAAKAIELGNGYYLRILLANFVSKGEKDKAQQLIDTARPHIDGDLLAFVEEQQQEILGSPEERIAYFEPIVESQPDNLDAWKALETAYRATGNRAKLHSALLKVNELEPTLESATKLAELEKSNANYALAERYFNEAVSRTDDNDRKKSLYLELADVQRNQGKLREARNTTQQVLQIDPNYGLAYLHMATVYGEAVSRCTEGRKLEATDKVVYWLVLDYLNKAKSVDPSVASSVNRQLPTYESAAPTAEDKFFTLGYEAGQKVKVDGSLNSCYSWINETVTVR